MRCTCSVNFTWESGPCSSCSGEYPCEGGCGEQACDCTCDEEEDDEES